MTNHPIELAGPKVLNHDNTGTTHTNKMDDRVHNLGDTKPISTGRTVKSVTMTKDAPLPPLPTELISISTTATAPPRTDACSSNVAKPILRDQLPKKQDRFDKTSQLAYCLTLLLENHKMELNEEEQGWLQVMEQDSIEQDHIRWLATRMVEEFVKDPFKNSVEISEIVLVGSILGREYYRKLLSTFIKGFEEARLLDVDLLQGLVQLVQSSSAGFLEPDDLFKILGVLRIHLEGTHQQSTEHPYHLTLAVSRVLDAMADHKVQSLVRVQEHEPLSGVLSGLKGSSDLYLLYQACYAFQALQYISDNETPLQTVLRHSTGVVDGLVKVSGVLKLDLASVLDGLESLQKSLVDTFKVASATYDRFFSLMESGQGVFDSLKVGYGFGKQSWYIAIRAAYVFAQACQLEDLKLLVYEAPCRGDPLFQWGICQLLGEVAYDTVMDTTHRKQAIDLLGSLYNNDPGWGQDESVKTWMVTIISQLTTLNDQAVSASARALLNKVKQIPSTTSKFPYPLRTRLPIPSSSPILCRVQNIPFIEYDLHKVRLQRLKEAQLPIYIPPMAKANLQAHDDDVFPLTEKLQEFLGSERQVMLILGDSGAGKSTFNTHLESELLRSYKGGGVIPLFINLPAIDQPDQDMVAKQLKIYNFSDDQIQELKLHRRFILICDGYDESQQLVNLYRTNILNQPGQWSAKMVISCRSQYLGQDYRSRFMPQSGGHYSRPATELFQEAVIAPFTRDQIENYVEQYVPLEPRTWTTQDYMDKLTAIPHFMDLVRNPFLLTLALEALPAVIEGQQDLSTIKLARVQLYDIFVVHWLNVNKRRLESNALSDVDRTIFYQLLDAGFVFMGIEYSTRLALAIFEKQKGNPVVKYTHLSDKKTWRVEFFGPDPEVRLLRESSPVTRTGSLFKFIHRSMLEYFFSRIVFDPSSQEESDEFALQQDASSSIVQSLDPDGPFFKQSLVGEPSIIQFLCDRVKQHPDFEKQLHSIVSKSKTDPSAAIAASNAISILVRAGVRFNGADLRGVRIPGADLSDGQLDSAQMQGADLRGVNFGRAWLRRVNWSNAQLEGVRFGERPFLQEDSPITSCAYSPDGTMIALGLQSWTIAIYETATWTNVHELKGHHQYVFSVAFSPDSQQLLSGGFDKTVRLWDVASGKLLVTMLDHSRAVRTVAFSPWGDQFASAGDDGTVRVWTAGSGKALFVMKGHNRRITGVAYSSDGLKLVSGSLDGTIRTWNTATGEAGAVWKPGRVYSLAFARDGKRVVSGHEKGNVQFWDAGTGRRGQVLSGHTSTVTDIAFSPDGHWVASSSEDRSVRLWNVSTGTLVSDYSGHNSDVNGVCFSPNGEHIVSVGADQTVRLWEVDLGRSSVERQGHNKGVYKVAYSPDGRSVTSGGFDATVREWNTLLGPPGSIVVKEIEYPNAMACSPDDCQIASGSSKGSVRQWSRQTGEAEQVLLGGLGSVKDMVYSPCGRWLLTASVETVRLWDLQDPDFMPTYTFSEDREFHASSVAFSPTGLQFAAGKTNNTIRLYDPQAGKLVKTMTLETYSSRALCYSPSGHQLAIGTDANVILLWDLESEKPGLELRRHRSPIACIAYSPCGQWIASGSEDETIHLWRKKKRAGEEEEWSFVYAVYGFFHTVVSVVWNPAVPMEFVSGCSDGSVRVWHVSVGDDDRRDSESEKDYDEDRVNVSMQWGSNLGRLCAMDLVSSDASGLCSTLRKLLLQKGAVDDSPPSPAPTGAVSAVGESEP